MNLGNQLGLQAGTPTKRGLSKIKHAKQAAWPQRHHIYLMENRRMSDGIATRHLANESGKTTPFSLSRGQIWGQT